MTGPRQHIWPSDAILGSLQHCDQQGLCGLGQDWLPVPLPQEFSGSWCLQCPVPTYGIWVLHPQEALSKPL